ncbi:Homeodomain-like superfamily protein [Raphanus sativus]|uniref:Uncharacterized protein LOC108856701 n=1 Tax=Raphanus sativus TaxID=3726 RepID=A0A6J0NQV5_RAPSA|nr:uncharacterized protein LOC108856701 [Raphanus sativus]KAJ4895741.1 Homeodomain-like superfamily protein [Raphanus sativus]
MSRKKSPVVSPQPASTSVLRRSARLVSQRSQGKPAKDPGFVSEPPPPKRKTRRELRPEAEKSPGGSLRRSLRVSKRGVSDAAGKEKSPPFSSAKPPASTPSSCSLTLRRSPRFSSGGVGGGSLFNLPSGNSVVLSSCSKTSTKQVSLKKDGVRSSRSRPRSKTKQMSSNDGEEGVSVRLSEEKGNGVRSSRTRPCPNTKQICIDCDCYDHDDEEGVSLCLGEVKRMKLSNENDNEGMRIIDKEEGLKKTKNERGGWTEELELALQGAYLTAKPSPHFWKNVSKLVPGKSAQECFDRVNADLITPRQTQPRSRAKKSDLSPIPRFSLSASKLLKPISPTKAKIRQRKGNLSKKAIRHLVEKQNHMDQGLGFDLFSVLEPGAASSFLSTPTEKGKSLPRIIESPVMPGSSKDQANLVSPPVLKQVKNKALHEKYIDHLHVREAKRKAEYNRLVGKENVRPVDNQTNVRAAKDALYFDVQDAVQKLKGLETENSSSSSEFCYGLGETDEEDESI